MNPEMILALAALISGVAGIISAMLLNRKTGALLEYRMEKVEETVEAQQDTAKEIARLREDLASIKTSIDFIKEEIKK